MDEVGTTGPKPGRVPRGRGRPPEGDVGRRTEELLIASADVFLEHGFSRASYEMIAREAGVSTKTIYAWFGGKAGLFAAVMEHQASRIEPQLRATLDAHGDNPERALTLFARIILAFELEPRMVALHSAVVAASRELPDIGSAFYALGPGKGVSMLDDYLASCVRAGRLRSADTTASAEMFLALTFQGALSRRLLRVEHGVPSASALERQVATALAVFLQAHRP